jgi:hypothetical protein
MKTKKLKKEKSDNGKFAFLPEMVLEHLNHAKPNEFEKIENSNEPEIQKITITAEPEIPGLDSLFEIQQKNNKAYTKNIVDETNLRN